jgi:hypothetical protein
MNRDEYVRLFHKLELNLVAFKRLLDCDEEVLKLVNAAIAAEREACADLLDKGVDLSGLAGSPSMQLFCATLLKGFADSIRERGAP